MAECLKHLDDHPLHGIERGPFHSMMVHIKKSSCHSLRKYKYVIYIVLNCSIKYQFFIFIQIIVYGKFMTKEQINSLCILPPYFQKFRLYLSIYFQKFLLYLSICFQKFRLYKYLIIY